MNNPQERLELFASAFGKARANAKAVEGLGDPAPIPPPKLEIARGIPGSRPADSLNNNQRAKDFVSIWNTVAERQTVRQAVITGAMEAKPVMGKIIETPDGKRWKWNGEVFKRLQHQ